MYHRGMDRINPERKGQFLPTNVLRSSDLEEGTYPPFVKPTVINANVDFGLHLLDKIQGDSKIVLYCHSNEERKNLTVGPDRVSVQEILDNFVKVNGQRIDYVVVCNPHRVRLKNCGAYIVGRPLTLLWNKNGELSLNTVMIDASSEYELVKGLF